MSIRILLADDQALVRAGFKMIIDAEPDLDVVAEASDGKEAVALARQTRPDVVLMDIRMPEVDGLTATRELVGDPALPGLKVVVLTTFEADELVFEALRSGASGFLGKGVAPEALLQAVRTVAGGEALLSPRATQTLISHYLAQPEARPVQVTAELSTLTEREREVLALVAAGLSNDDIAARLFVSPLTAKTHVNRIMSKLGARDRAQLVVLAYRTGFARAPE